MASHKYILKGKAMARKPRPVKDQYGAGLIVGASGMACACGIMLFFLYGYTLRIQKELIVENNLNRVVLEHFMLARRDLKTCKQTKGSI